MYIMNKDCILFRFSKNCVFFVLNTLMKGIFFKNNNFILYEHFFII